jgi:hypothetical protein
MVKQNKTTSAFCLMAAACFSAGIALNKVELAMTACVFLGTICILAAAFFASQKEMK